MLELVLRFAKPANFLLFLGLIAANILWVYVWFKKKETGPLAPVVAVNLILGVAWAVLWEINHDDAGYLHLAWLISRGLVPFRDYWDHHSPLFTVLISPLFSRFSLSTGTALILARVFSGLMLVLNTRLAWAIASRVWGRKRNLWVFLVLLTSMIGQAHYFVLRPDLFMMFLLLAVVYICLDIPQGGLRSPFLAGAAFSLAMSFITKQYFLVFLPVIAIFLGEKKTRIAKLFSYFLGLAAGCLPLAAYLTGQGIVKEYFFWTVWFNKRLLMLTVYFPVIMLGAGAWGARSLWRLSRESGRPDYAVMVAAFGLSLLSGLATTSNLDGLYYLAFWYFLCAICASGAGFPEMLMKAGSRISKAMIAGLVFSFLVLPNLIPVWIGRTAVFAREIKAVDRLMEYARGDTCVVLLPAHPLFVADATRLYAGWQYLFYDRYPAVNEDTLRKDIAGQIIARKPAVVLARYRKRDFILELFQKKLITARQYGGLIRFLQDNYVQEPIGQQSYYIRRDRINKQ